MQSLCNQERQRGSKEIKAMTKCDLCKGETESTIKFGILNKSQPETAHICVTCCDCSDPETFFLINAIIKLKHDKRLLQYDIFYVNAYFPKIYLKKHSVGRPKIDPEIKRMHRTEYMKQYQKKRYHEDEAYKATKMKSCLENYYKNKPDNNDLKN